MATKANAPAASTTQRVAELDDPRLDAFGMLLEAHNELLNTVTRRLQDELGLPVPWLGVLIRLSRSPDCRLRMSELAKDMTMSTSGLTRLVDRVEAAGHVERQACPDDRRGTWVVLTEAGRALVAASAPMHLADLDRFLADALDDGELERLTDLLRKVRDHIRRLDADR